jgi:hypothetical protein
MTQIELNKLRAEVMLGAKYKQKDWKSPVECINVECIDSSKQDDEWDIVSNPCWDWNRFDYRLAKEPKYKPYSKADISWLGKVVKDTNTEHAVMITGVGDDDTVLVGLTWATLRSVFSGYTWADGTPFGEIDDE